MPWSFHCSPQSWEVFREAKSPEDKASYSGDGGVCGVGVSWSLLDTCLHPRFGSQVFGSCPQVALAGPPSPSLYLDALLTLHLPR